MQLYQTNSVCELWYPEAYGTRVLKAAIILRIIISTQDAMGYGCVYTLRHAVISSKPKEVSRILTPYFPIFFMALSVKLPKSLGRERKQKYIIIIFISCV